MERIIRGAKRKPNDIIDNVKQTAAAIGDTVSGAVNKVVHLIMLGKEQQEEIKIQVMEHMQY